MTNKRKGREANPPQRIELGRYIVADPEVCHGKPTFKGTRIMVWQVLDELAHGLAPEEIVKAWDSKVSREAIVESVAPQTMKVVREGERERERF